MVFSRSASVLLKSVVSAVQEGAEHHVQNAGYDEQHENEKTVALNGKIGIRVARREKVGQHLASVQRRDREQIKESEAEVD